MPAYSVASRACGAASRIPAERPAEAVQAWYDESVQPTEDVMDYARCAQCGRLYEEEILLQREDDGRRVCPACSGLLAGEDLDCRYDETG